MITFAPPITDTTTTKGDGSALVVVSVQVSTNGKARTASTIRAKKEDEVTVQPQGKWYWLRALACRIAGHPAMHSDSLFRQKDGSPFWSLWTCVRCGC